MKTKHKKICLLLAGGTTIDEKNIFGSSVNKKEDVNKWLNLIPELFLIAKIEPIFISNENFKLEGVKLWQEVSKTISDNYPKYDGFVVLFKTQDILFNGLALSFALQNLGKPVILTGSQITEESIKHPDWPDKKSRAFGGLGVKSNLINAVQMATMDFPAVGLMFGNQCIRPVKAQRTAIYALNLFSSIDNSHLAKIDFGISPTEKFKSTNKKLILKNKFESKVIYLKYYPGLNWQLTKKFLNESQGIVIENLTGESLPKEFITNLSKLNILFIIYNNIFTPRLNKKNLIEVNNMTPETTLIKFMWALEQAKNNEELRVLMYQEFCGEIINL